MTSARDIRLWSAVEQSISSNRCQLFSWNRGALIQFPQVHVFEFETDSISEWLYGAIVQCYITEILGSVSLPDTPVHSYKWGNEAAHTINNLFVLYESPGCKCKARLVTPFPVRQWSTPSGNYPGNHVLYENIGLPKLWLSLSIPQWQNRVLDDTDHLSAFLFLYSWLPNLVD